LEGDSFAGAKKIIMAKNGIFRTSFATYDDDFTPENGILSPKNACFSGIYAEITTG